MNNNRLEAVLTRNRKHLVVDVALAAFFLMALLFSGLAFGSQLPKLSVAPLAEPTAVTPVAQGVDPSGTAFEASTAETDVSPELAYH